MRIPLELKTVETLVKKSRFISYAIPVETPEEAKIQIKALKEKYTDASHVVSAFLLGLENSQNAGYSDDGEPHGTAGRPVFEVLKGSGVTNLLIAVVRFFGGTKLGTGGLVKAYGDAAKSLLQDLKTEEWIPRVSVELCFDYTFAGGVKNLLQGTKIQITEEKFETRVTFSVLAPLNGWDSMKKRLIDLCKGSIEIREE